MIVLGLSAVSFGGGSTLLAGLERELVQTHVITPAQFMAGMALGQTTPGPLAAFTASIGSYVAGLAGALAAAAAMVVVSLAVVMLIRRVPSAWFQLPPVRSSLSAVSAYIVAILFFLGYKSMTTGNHDQWSIPAVIVGLMIVGRQLKIPTAYLMLGSVALGMLTQGTHLAGW
jgi:chromate transporter